MLVRLAMDTFTDRRALELDLVHAFYHQDPFATEPVELEAAELLSDPDLKRLFLEIEIARVVQNTTGPGLELPTEFHERQRELIALGDPDITAAHAESKLRVHVQSIDLFHFQTMAKHGYSSQVDTPDPDEAKEKLMLAVKAERKAGASVENFITWVKTQVTLPRINLPVVSSALSTLSPGSLTIVGGDTNAGKSRVLSWWLDQYETTGQQTAFISMEDPENIIIDRLISSKCGLSVEAVFRKGRMTDEIKQRIGEACKAVASYGALYYYPQGFSYQEIIQCMTRAVREHSAKVVFLDYIQLLEMSRDDADQGSVHPCISSLKRIKKAARELGVPLVAASQLVRPQRGKKNERPEPSVNNLKYGGDLENMAENVILLWKENEESHAATVGKVAKSKTSSLRPRFKLVCGRNGVINTLEEWDPDEESIITPDSNYGKWDSAKPAQEPAKPWLR